MLASPSPHPSSPDALALPEPASPTRSPKRTHGSPTRPRSPVKLTPLERKERDRQRQKEQGQRRLQAIKDRDAQAAALLAGQHKSSQWHRQEREEEELVLRRLERDLVDAQRCHPAAVGYRFSPARHARDAATNSPVFMGYSPAPCPPSQAQAYSTKAPAVTVTHPAFTSYCVAKHNDAAALSPVFFFVRYGKIPLDEINIDDDEATGSNSDDSDDDEEGAMTHEQFLARQQLRDGPGAGRIATITKLEAAQQLELQETLRRRFVVDAGASCLVCRGRSAVGCPGCFELSHRTYQKVQSAKSTQRLKTPKTHSQEASERQARYTELRLKLMGYGRRSEGTMMGDEVLGEEVDEDEEEAREPSQRRPMTSEQRDYYVNVLTNIQAVRKHRSVMRNYVTLHVKTLPVGNLITLQVDVRSTIAYVYELYRSHLDSPNRKIHLLLPTTAGLFYLNELMESATDTRCGLVNGEFLVEDFQLSARLVEPPASPLAKRNALREAQRRDKPQTEFLLFSVAILSEHSTPQLVANFLQQNFHFDDDDALPVQAGGLRIEYAIARLPRTAIAEDVYQRRLVPHVHRMKEFARVSKQLELLEQERERERVLWVAYQERKLARLAHKKKQRLLAQGGEGRRSRKVMRAIAYLDFVLESTSNAARARVYEERLHKLWQCAQRFEEWKLCKHGRLVDAESTSDTRALVQRLLDATVAAFDKVLARSAGSGPLAYPIQCVGANGGASQPKLVVQIGLRLGCSALDNYAYGLVLDLEQDFDAMAAAKTAALGDDDRRRMKTRGFTKKQLLVLTDEAAKRDEAASSWRCADLEWKPKAGASDSQATLLFAGSDLVRMPFLQFPWHLVAQAYQHTLESLAFQLAKLDEYNALARLLQQEDAQLGKAQIAKWGDDVQQFEQGLLALGTVAGGGKNLVKGSAILRATQRVLAKKGVALLKKRLRQRRQKMREREQELERLRELQEANSKPKKSVVEMLKLHFIQEKAPKINAVLEPTPAERLLAKAEQLLGAVASKASSAATAAKKEYNVRAL